MKILYLSLDPPLDQAQVATGNQVRVQGIRGALEQAGHQVIQATYTTHEDMPSSSSVVYYQTVQELDALLAEEAIDVILVGFWSLLPHLPITDLPVVLDFIAPRILELMYQDPEAITEEVNSIIKLLPRADHFLVGNQRQADLLLPYLLMAGLDCRQRAPISIVPISAQGNIAPGRSPELPLRLVNAGVDWPWRKSAEYRQVLEKLAAENAAVAFVEHTGAYPGDYKTGQATSLLSYAGMQDELQRCHIGLELGERNTEREFSHSFRALEYLECGLPVIINPWIRLSETINEYNAGWVISSPGELDTLLREILANPGILEEKRLGARKLAMSALNYSTSCKPLLAFLQSPSKTGHLFTRSRESGVLPVKPDAEIGNIAYTSDAKVIPLTVRQPSNLKIILANLFRRFLCPNRPDSCPDILMVTRADLFPVDHGAAVKIIRTAESLSRLGRDVWLTTDNRKEYYQFSGGVMSTHRFPFWVRYLCLPRSFAYVKLMKMGFPRSNSFLYLPMADMSYTVRTIYLASRKPVGAFQAEFPAYVKPCRNARSLFGGKILLVQHNVEYERIRNQVPNMSEKQYRNLKYLELDMCAEADSIVAVSGNDREKMITDGVDGSKIHIIPHGVDLYAFREARPIDIKRHYKIPAQDKVLVYHGTYSYAPNLEAINVMATEILPRLAKRGLSVSTLAIGSKPPDWPLHAKIIFAGSVTDLTSVLPAADLAVIPLLEGGGTRMKILDYFAARVPVISTTKGIEGIPVENGRQACIIDGYDEICDAIEKLLADPDAADKMRNEASAFVDSLSWDTVVRRYLPLLH